MITLFIGTQFNRSGRQIPAYWRDPAIRAIKDKALAEFDGYSASFVTGGWIDNGQAIEERVLRLEIAGVGFGAAIDFAGFCAKTLQQKSILVICPGRPDKFVSWNPAE